MWAASEAAVALQSRPDHLRLAVRQRGCGARRRTPSTRSRRRPSKASRCNGAEWSARGRDGPFSNGHFCSAFFFCFVVAFQGASLKLSTSFCRAGRQAVHQAGNGLEEGKIGDHRRQHAAHADFLVRLGHRRQALDRRQVGTRPRDRRPRCSPSRTISAAPIIADRYLSSRFRPVPTHWLAVSSNSSDQRSLQTLGEIARPMGVGVHQSGMDQAMPRHRSRPPLRARRASPGRPISAIVSPLMRISTGVALCLATSRSLPPRMTVWVGRFAMSDSVANKGPTGRPETADQILHRHRRFPMGVPEPCRPPDGLDQSQEGTR